MMIFSVASDKIPVATRLQGKCHWQIEPGIEFKMVYVSTSPVHLPWVRYFVKAGLSFTCSLTHLKNELFPSTPVFLEVLLL